jgi:hypothetical protein
MCYAATHSGLSSRQSTEAGLKFASSTAVQQQVQIRTPAPTDVPASLLAVFSLTPDPAVGAHAFADAVVAVAPDAVMLADAGALAVRADAPAEAVMLADAGASAVFAFTPLEGYSW